MCVLHAHRGSPQNTVCADGSLACVLVRGAHSCSRAWPDAKNNAHINAALNSAILKLKSSDNLPQKVGADSKNWIAGYLHKTLFIEKFNFDDKNSYPDGGTSVTIFGNHLFSELECLSPEKKLKIGETICYDLQWSLLKIEDKNNVNSILESL